MRRTLIPTVALALALVLAACGGSDGDSGDSEPAAASNAGGVTIEATEFEFTPQDFTLPAEEATDLTLDNIGVVEHDIVVEELDDEELVYAGPGEAVTENVTLAAGTYTYYCSIPGHRDAGMEGTLTVE